jgi:hypothetical protein
MDAITWSGSTAAIYSHWTDAMCALFADLLDALATIRRK